MSGRNLPTELVARMRKAVADEYYKPALMSEAADEIERQERALTETHDAWTAETTKRLQAERERDYWEDKCGLIYEALTGQHRVHLARLAPDSKPHFAITDIMNLACDRCGKALGKHIGTACPQDDVSGSNSTTEKSMKLPDIEAVSAEVHDAWMKSKLAKGVSSRRSETGEELMVSYHMLSEAAKDLDRGSVQAVYRAIEALG